MQKTFNKKRPKSVDYLAATGKKTPLGKMSPPLSKKEIKVGLSLEQKVKKILEQHRLNKCYLLNQRKK